MLQGKLNLLPIVNLLLLTFLFELADLLRRFRDCLRAVRCEQLLSVGLDFTSVHDGYSICYAPLVSPRYKG